MHWNGNEWVAESPPRAAHAAKPESRVKRVGAAALEAALITALTFGLIAGTAFAGKGGGGGGRGGHGGGGSTTGGSGTISLQFPLVLDRNGNGTPNWNDAVRFDVSTTSTTSPYVNLFCYQNGAFVGGGSEGYFAGALDDGNFGLSAPSWGSGAADCTAKLVTGSGSVLGSTSFHVDA
jgi:hypothetical protein